MKTPNGESQSSQWLHGWGRSVKSELMKVIIHQCIESEERCENKKVKGGRDKAIAMNMRGHWASTWLFIAVTKCSKVQGSAKTQAPKFHEFCLTPLPGLDRRIHSTWGPPISRSPSSYKIFFLEFIFNNMLSSESDTSKSVCCFWKGLQQYQLLTIENECPIQQIASFELWRLQHINNSAHT